MAHNNAKKIPKYYQRPIINFGDDARIMAVRQHLFKQYNNGETL